MFELDAPTCKLTVIAVEGVPFLMIAPDIHRKIHETNLETTHSSLASLIRGVVEERELVTMGLLAIFLNDFRNIPSASTLMESTLSHASSMLVACSRDAHRAELCPDV